MALIHRKKSAVRPFPSSGKGSAPYATPNVAIDTKMASTNQMDSPTNTVLENLNNSTDNMLIDGMEEDGGTSNNEEDIEEMIHITASSSNDFNTPINPGGNI
jgi:hypothetical protein